MRVGSAEVLTAVFAALLLAPLPVWSQGPDAAERPVTALVLSGGGARGGAHLGVIKALEELRVPVDLVTGTSIGAAIGGLYASGMTVEELETFVDGIDWEAAFLNSTPRRLQSFRRKRDDELFFLDTRPGLDGEGLSLPAGVVQGQVIDTIMARVTLPVAAVDDFDALALPFRAVAGDLETGEAVILSGGNLARALRASMSVPAVVTPIEIDGRLLVDGGIAMNLPVEVAQDLGAERIIAVDISERLQSRDDIRSVVDVTTQLTGMLTMRGTLDQIDRLGEQDVLLRPDFDDQYSSMTFGRLAETIDAGYEAVMQNREVLEPFRLGAEDYAAYRAAREDPRVTELPSIDFIRFGPTAPLAESVVETRMDDVDVGFPLDLDALEESMNRVYGLAIYQNVRYALVEEGARRGIDLDLTERSWGPSYVQLGLRYSSATDEDALFGLDVSYLRTAMNALGGEMRATFKLGDEPGFLADWYQPLGPKALTFVNPALDLGSEVLNVFDEGELAAEVKLRTATLELGVGREFMDLGELRGGVRVGAGDTELRSGDPLAIPFSSFHLGELFTRFSVDTLDNISFPREGSYATVEWRGSNRSALGADDDYDQLSIHASHAITWNRHTLRAALRYDATISGEAPVYRLFSLGGFRDLSGLNVGELTGQHATRLGASYYRRIGDFALFPVFVGFSAGLANVWDRRSDMSVSDSIWGGSIWAGVDTPAGPVFLAYGSAEGGRDAFYVLLGRSF